LNSALCCFLFTPTSHVLWTGQPLAYPAVQKSGAAASAGELTRKARLSIGAQIAKIEMLIEQLERVAVEIANHQREIANQQYEFARQQQVFALQPKEFRAVTSANAAESFAT
jgi:hypothetical protein